MVKTSNYRKVYAKIMQMLCKDYAKIMQRFCKDYAKIMQLNYLKFALFSSSFGKGFLGHDIV